MLVWATKDARVGAVYLFFWGEIGGQVMPAAGFNVCSNGGLGVNLSN